LDKRSILISFSLCASSLWAAPTATEIYQKTVKVFSVPQLKFQVLSTMTSGSYSQKQLFSIARRQDGDITSSLVCFAYPADVKGTAILIKKDGHDTQSSVYFPAIGRIRLIPKENENEEVFGLGLSFSELQNNQINLRFLPQKMKNAREYYEIEKRVDNHRTIYEIDKETLILKKMDVYDNATLEKEIFVDDSKVVEGNMMVTKWHILDHVKDQTLTYTVRESSVQTKVEKKLFVNSLLTHCKF